LMRRAANHPNEWLLREELAELKELAGSASAA
jgi:hypothetical protein